MVRSSWGYIFIAWIRYTTLFYTHHGLKKIQAVIFFMVKSMFNFQFSLLVWHVYNFKKIPILLVLNCSKWIVSIQTEKFTTPVKKMLFCETLFKSLCCKFFVLCAATLKLWRKVVNYKAINPGKEKTTLSFFHVYFNSSKWPINSTLKPTCYVAFIKLFSTRLFMSSKEACICMIIDLNKETQKCVHVPKNWPAYFLSDSTVEVVIFIIWG